MEDTLIRFRLVNDEAQALRRLSINEARRPVDQARYILRQRLIELGYLRPTLTAPQEAQHERQPV